MNKFDSKLKPPSTIPNNLSLSFNFTNNIKIKVSDLNHSIKLESVKFIQKTEEVVEKPKKTKKRKIKKNKKKIEKLPVLSKEEEIKENTILAENQKKDIKRTNLIDFTASNKRSNSKNDVINKTSKMFFPKIKESLNKDSNEDSKFIKTSYCAFFNNKTKLNSVQNIPIISNESLANSINIKPININNASVNQHKNSPIITKREKKSKSKGKYVLKQLIDTDKERLNKFKAYVSEQNKQHLNFEKGCLYYIIDLSNNGKIFKEIMKLRINWKECASESNSLFNFKWKETSLGVNFSKLNKIPSIKQSVNHFEFHSELSNKLNLFINMLIYCENNNLNVFDYIPMTIIANYDSNTYNLTLENFTKIFNNIKNNDYLKKYTPEEIFNKKNKPYKKTREVINHFNILKYSTYFNLSEFCITDKLGSKTQIDIKEPFDKNLWLVKAINLNRGQCIKITNKIEDIKFWTKQFY